MPTEAEIAAATSPAQNEGREAELRQPMSFRERTMQRLGGAPEPEREEVAPASEDYADEGSQDLGESREASSEEEIVEGGDREVAEDTDGVEDGEEAGDGSQLTPRKLAEMAGIEPDQLYGMEIRFGDGPDDVFTLEGVKDRYRELQSVDGLRQEIDAEAVESTRTMVEQVQELGDQLEAVAGEAEFFANLAEAGVRQFQGVDWDQLRTDPQKYAEMERRYSTALRNRDQLKARFDELRTRRDEAVQRAKQKQTQASLAVLKRLDRNWGPERYASIREFAAENLHFKPEEVDQILDWRVMRLLSREHDNAKAGEKVRGVSKREKGGAKPGSRRAQTARPRNAQGRFQSARQRAFERPGDRSSFREMKEAQLAANRGGRR